jgi:IS5 family transposase
LRAIEGARTGLADLGDLTDEEVDRIERELVAVARKAGVDALPLREEIREHQRRMRKHARRARRR